jgi:hypothetical protein
MNSNYDAKRDVNAFLGNIQGSNQYYNQRAGKTALEILLALFFTGLFSRRNKNKP